MMQELTATEAKQIHEIILQSGDKALIARYEATLKSQSATHQGHYPMTMEWAGTPINARIRQQLAQRFGLEYLQERNLLQDWGDPDSSMELRVLAGALPAALLNSYYTFDSHAEAKEIGVDYEQFKQELKTMFVGTIGVPGEPDFGILLDAGMEDIIIHYMGVLGLTMLWHPYGKATVDRLSAEGGHECLQLNIHQGRLVYAMGIDANAVYLITPNHSPFAIRTMAQIFNFPGAQHYLSTAQEA